MMSATSIEQEARQVAHVRARKATSCVSTEVDGVLEQAAPSTDAVMITVPVPPSVNEMFRNKAHGRVKTRIYEDWISHASWVLKQQKPKSIKGNCIVFVAVERTSNQADIDNRIKAIFDLLVLHKVIVDDKYIVGFAAAWSPPNSKLARVMVLPAQDLTCAFHLATEGACGGWFLTHHNQKEGEPNGTFDC